MASTSCMCSCMPFANRILTTRNMSSNANVHDYSMTMPHGGGACARGLSGTVSAAGGDDPAGGHGARPTRGERGQTLMAESIPRDTSRAGTARLTVVIPGVAVGVFFGYLLEYCLPLYFGARSTAAQARGGSYPPDAW